MKTKLLAKNLIAASCEGERVPFKLVVEPLSISETERIVAYVLAELTKTEIEWGRRRWDAPLQLSMLRLNALYSRLEAALGEKHKQQE